MGYNEIRKSTSEIGGEMFEIPVDIPRPDDDPEFPEPEDGEDTEGA